MPHISVFTPMYNRSHTIRRVYESLKKQTYNDFEWIVVDDGSSDNSVAIVEELIRIEKSFHIILFRNKHGGKHRAVNKGLDLASGKLFFMLDSDDWLTNDSLERVAAWEKRIPANAKCSGLCACMQDENGNKITKGLKEEYIFMPLTKMIKKGIDGDRADILFTDVFRKYKYPDIENEYHIAPGVPFVRMANDGYNLLFFNETIYIAEYGADGLTAMGDKKSLDNFKGYTLRTKELLHSDVGLKKKCKLAIKYSFLSKKKQISIKNDAYSLDIPIMYSLIARLLSTLL